MTLAEKIMDLRKRAGLSQEDLANELGVTRQSVSKWESTSATPDVAKIVQMSKLFGVSTDYLLKDDLDDEINANSDQPGLTEKTNDKVFEESRRSFSKAYWGVITAVYLVYSFLTSDWGVSWLIYPVAAAVFAVINLVLKSKKK